MAKFDYNNVKNVSIGYTPFELNCGYHSHILYKKNINSDFKLKIIDKLWAQLKELIIV